MHLREGCGDDEESHVQTSRPRSARSRKLRARHAESCRTCIRSTNPSGSGAQAFFAKGAFILMHTEGEDGLDTARTLRNVSASASVTSTRTTTLAASSPPAAGLFFAYAMFICFWMVGREVVEAHEAERKQQAPGNHLAVAVADGSWALEEGSTGDFGRGRRH